MTESINTCDVADVADEEIVLRHIPGGSLFQKPPPAGPAITSSNFQIRFGEEYISLERLKDHTVDEVIALTGGDRLRNSRIGWCRVSGLRKAGFQVESRPLPHYPGHAGLFGSPDLLLTDKKTRQLLALLFRFEPIEL